MANILYANNAIGTLAAPITNFQTAITLNPGQAALFPNPSAPQVFYATLTDAATQTLKEIVQVTAAAGNIFSVVRAQDGTTGLSWNTGDIIEQCVIRLELQNFENAAEGQFGAAGLNTAITPSSTLGIVGTALADNANAGSVGEYVDQLNVPVNMVSNVATNVGSVSLTPGDWDVTCSFRVTISSSACNNIAAGVSQVSATFGDLRSFVQNLSSGTSLGLLTSQFPSQMVRFSLASSTTIFAVSQVGFSSGSVTVQAYTRARRVR